MELTGLDCRSEQIQSNLNEKLGKKKKENLLFVYFNLQGSCSYIQCFQSGLLKFLFLNFPFKFNIIQVDPQSNLQSSARTNLQFCPQSNPIHNSRLCLQSNLLYNPTQSFSGQYNTKLYPQSSSQLHPIQISNQFNSYFDPVQSVTEFVPQNSP